MSSEDPTQPMPGGADTKPSLEAVIYRIDRLGALVLERLAVIESNQQKMDVRLDRIESEVKQMHSEFYTLRADFKEFRAQFKEPA